MLVPTLATSPALPQAPAVNWGSFFVCLLPGQSTWRRCNDRKNASKPHTNMIPPLSAKLGLVPPQKGVFECAVTDTRKSYALRGKRRAIGALHIWAFSRVRQYSPFEFNPYWDPYTTGKYSYNFHRESHSFTPGRFANPWWCKSR